MSPLGPDAVHLTAAIRYRGAMKISLDGGTATYRILSYAQGQVAVNEQVLTRSLVVMPEALLSDWPPQDFEALAAEHFVMIAALRPEIVLLGTGAGLRFPSPALLVPLYDAGIGVEVMDTGAACRTYDILMAEGRAVAAALLMI
jgi:uncharacterized protein